MRSTVYKAFYIEMGAGPERRSVVSAPRQQQPVNVMHERVSVRTGAYASTNMTASDLARPDHKSDTSPRPRSVGHAAGFQCGYLAAEQIE